MSRYRHAEIAERLRARLEKVITSQLWRQSATLEWSCGHDFRFRTRRRVEGWMVAVLAMPRPLTMVKARPEVNDLEEVYRRFGPAIHRRCFQLLADKEDALDALQDIFLNLHAKLNTFRGDAELMTWLYRVSTNHCLNRLRAQRSRAKLIDRESVVDEQASNTFVHEVERRDLLRSLLSELDAETVQLLVHYYCDEMNQAEIASVLGVSERTVRSRLRKVEARSHGLIEALKKVENI